MKFSTTQTLLSLPIFLFLVSWASPFPSANIAGRKCPDPFDPVDGPPARIMYYQGDEMPKCKVPSGLTDCYQNRVVTCSAGVYYLADDCPAKGWSCRDNNGNYPLCFSHPQFDCQKVKRPMPGGV